ncbi:MAG: UDP-N-acetylmuramate dehydrogenase [Oscillospiraceae bacterium]|nr:UDP-N-acetylmuramate dehydrogenase [Oscillospiraceae bacterium]
MVSVQTAIEAIKNEYPHIECRIGELMRNHTSLRIGGAVAAMFLPASIEELSLLCEALANHDSPIMIIGNGTNLLVDDRKALDIIVVKTTKMNKLQLIEDGKISAQAGISLAKLAVFALENNLSGFEFAHGIPGSLGGAIVMNAGAYGMEMKDVVLSTKALTHTPSLKLIDIVGNEHQFSYRHSRFSDNDDIIISSVIGLELGDKADIKAKMDELQALRSESQPLDMPSAGSTFKRPKDGYAAQMIDKAGLKGFTIGGAQVSLKHSGFIVNHNGGTFSDVLGIISHVKEVVFSKFGVELDLEYKIIEGI